MLYEELVLQLLVLLLKLALRRRAALLVRRKPARKGFEHARGQQEK